MPRRALPRPKNAGRMRKFLARYREEAAAQERGSVFTDQQWLELRRDAARTMAQHDARTETRLFRGPWADPIREDD